MKEKELSIYVFLFDNLWWKWKKFLKVTVKVCGEIQLAYLSSQFSRELIGKATYDNLPHILLKGNTKREKTITKMKEKELSIYVFHLTNFDAYERNLRSNSISWEYKQEQQSDSIIKIQIQVFQLCPFVPIE